MKKAPTPGVGAFFIPAQSRRPAGSRSRFPAHGYRARNQSLTRVREHAGQERIDRECGVERGAGPFAIAFGDRTYKLRSGPTSGYGRYVKPLPGARDGRQYSN